MTEWDYAYTLTLSLATFMAFMRLFRPLSFNQKLAELKSAMKRASRTIMDYTIIFGIVLMCYASSLYLVLGATLYYFKSPGNAFHSLFGVLLGIVKYSTSFTIDSLAGRFIFGSYLMVSNMLLLNMFLAVIGESFAAVTSDELQQIYDRELNEHFWFRLSAWWYSTFSHKQIGKSCDK